MLHLECRWHPHNGPAEAPSCGLSTISNQDFLDLKSEFLKFPSKVKLFQGFQLDWAEMSAMVWTNFLASFKPKVLEISGKIIGDPWTNLGHLLLPVASTLTHLDVEIAKRDSSCPPLTTLLNDLANLEGLKLKYLKLGKIYNFFPKTLNDYKRALEKLFQSQCATLEELKLTFTWFTSKPHHLQLGAHQIQLPIFPRLHSLDLILKEKRPIGLESSIFAPFDFNLIFPKLEQLTIPDSLLFEMKDESIRFTRGHPLKKLEIVGDSDFEEDYGDILVALSLSFPHIEEFIFLDDGGIEIPWAETLRTLEVDGIRESFDFKHLKKLEHLNCIFYDRIEFPITSLIENLSEHLHQLPNLKSIHLTSEGMTQEIIDGIREGVPAEFRAILTFDL